MNLNMHKTSLTRMSYDIFTKTIEKFFDSSKAMVGQRFVHATPVGSYSFNKTWSVVRLKMKIKFQQQKKKIKKNDDSGSVERALKISQSNPL